MPPSILITNFHSSLNSGDLALLEMTVHLLKAAFEEPIFSVVSNWPEEQYFKDRPELRVIPSPGWLSGSGTAVPVWRQAWTALDGYRSARQAANGHQPSLRPGWKQLVEAYQNTDIVVATSGNQFYSTGRYGWPFPLTIMQVNLANLFRKPLFVFPQSIGPLRRSWERSMLGSAYRKAQIVFLRDAVSMRLARDIGLPEERIRYAPDPAFAYPADQPEKAGDVLRRWGYDQTKPSIGVTLVAPHGRSLDRTQVHAYYANLAALLTRIDREVGAQIFIFNQVIGPTDYDDDRAAISEVRRLAGDAASRFIWVNEELSPSLLKACYGHMDLLIGSRLHSGIFAMGMHVPVMMVGYLSKTRGLMESLGLADWVIELSEASGDILWKEFQRAWAERELRAKKLADLLPGVERQINSISNWMRMQYVSSAS